VISSFKENSESSSLESTSLYFFDLPGFCLVIISLRFVFVCFGCLEVDVLEDFESTDFKDSVESLDISGIFSAVETYSSNKQ